LKTFLPGVEKTGKPFASLLKNLYGLFVALKFLTKFFLTIGFHY